MPTKPNADQDSPVAASEPAKQGDLETYHSVADTVGMVPNIRVKDNVIQGLVIGGGTLVSAVVGLVIGGGIGVLIGAVVGMIFFLLVSGAVLMVIGWVRTAKKLKKSN